MQVQVKAWLAEPPRKAPAGKKAPGKKAPGKKAAKQPGVATRTRQ
jgi:hypothetical protein